MHLRELTFKKLVIGSSALLIWICINAASSPLHPGFVHCIAVFCALSHSPGPPNTSSLSLLTYTFRSYTRFVSAYWYGQVWHSRWFVGGRRGSLGALVKGSVGLEVTVRTLLQEGQTVGVMLAGLEWRRGGGELQRSILVGFGQVSFSWWW